VNTHLEEGIQMKTTLLMLTCLLLSTSAIAQTERRAAPCQEQAPQRMVWPNGSLLWGGERGSPQDETSTILASVDLASAQLHGASLKGLRLEQGRLSVPSLGSGSLEGTLLQGTSSTGKKVEVALCDAQPSPQDPSLLLYRIEIWNAESATWKNPCIATRQVPLPRALAMQGLWDSTGAHRADQNKFTFACQNGAIAKCASWGYKPWASKDGQSLAPLHQACTRMARADYCGDGRSHTREDSPIDMYDGLQVLTRTTEPSSVWNPASASFEAAWTPEGASCVSRTRDGQALEKILAQCPDRFEPVAQDLGEGDHCTVRRKSTTRTSAALLRNHSYAKQEPVLLNPKTP
jgi:hypothetical protein